MDNHTVISFPRSGSIWLMNLFASYFDVYWGGKVRGIDFIHDIGNLREMSASELGDRYGKTGVRDVAYGPRKWILRTKRKNIFQGIQQ